MRAGRQRPGAARLWTIGLAALVRVAAPEAAEAATPAPTWCHEVRRGETLATIARRAGITLAQARRDNGVRQGEPVPPGTILALPTLAALESGELRLSASTLRARPGHPSRENGIGDAERLSRLRSRAQLDRFVAARLLVPVAEEARGVRVVGVPGWRRVARPWTRTFIRQLGSAMAQLFGASLRVTDLTRTVAVQAALLGSNGNAAPAQGPHRSSHLTGASVDLSKALHSDAEVQWLRLVLRRLTRRGVVLAIEEFVQPHFHVMVRRQYADYARRLRSSVLIGGC
jgi:LysM repeat protein